MANNKRISALPEKANPSIDDIIPIVDTQNPNSPATKRTTVGALIGLAGPGGTIVGATGATGVNGATGARGATGIQGATGAVGATGSQGPAGLSGPRGATGVQGATGPAGVTGATGVQGPVGVTGATGVPGATGPKGDAGAGVTVKGAVTDWPPDVSPAVGDMWLLTTPVPAGAPAGSAAGDGVVWSGASWVNVGPIRGPQGATGPQGPAGNPASNFVLSVNGQTGAVNLTPAIIGAAPATIDGGVF